MNLIKSVSIKNFKAIREKQLINLLQGSYIIGGNNSGKTTVLQAIELFFSSNLPTDESFLNKSEYLAKKEGHNRCEIEIEINLEVMVSKERNRRLVGQYGKVCKLTKIFIYRERTRNCVIRFSINGKSEIPEDALNSDLKNLLDSVKVTYLHPQDGVELLRRAQEKLRNRLILNWGRRGEVTDSLEKLKSDWQALRRSSDTYLSRSLSLKLQQIWPGCEVKVNLPKNIEDIIQISDVGIKGSKGMPEVALTSQGTGAQSMILYLAHFLLDSDRSLHRGEYHPLWLLEEPESFLHADLIFQIGKQLSSKEWLANIQMIVSTHSPIILACSHESSEQINWSLMNDHNVEKNKPLKEWTEDDIAFIGNEMGDNNFEVYFTYAEKRNYFMFLEDSRKETVDSLIRSGLEVTKGLNGTGEINKYIDTYPTIQPSIKKDVFFLIDNDLGKKDFNRFLKRDKIVATKENISKYKISDGIFILLLPEETACEGLIAEFDNFLKEKVDLLYAIDKKAGSYKFTKSIPASLSRTHTAIREKGIPANIDAAKKLIKNTKDVKDLFWKKVSDEKLTIEKKFQDALRTLTEG